MSIDWGRVFDFWGEKQVTYNDKEKNAYIVNADQRRTIEEAGYSPSPVKPALGFQLAVLFDQQVESVHASYYYAERSLEAARAPEARIGREFISTWLNEGDWVTLGRVGSSLFAFKSHLAPHLEELAVQELGNRADPRVVIRRAMQAVGRPISRTVQRVDYVRNPWVVSAALLRANSRCEMPACRSEPIWRVDGSIYLEVHHIMPLGEGGEDALHNVAALCPRCHRELHHGHDRQMKRANLHSHIMRI